VALVIMVVLIKVAAAIYTDPRPFVVDPSIEPLFAHPADNGFPSDHTALAATVALVVMMYRRWLGAGLLAAGIVLGAARVAAHVHHAPDIAPRGADRGSGRRRCFGHLAVGAAPSAVAA